MKTKPFYGHLMVVVALATGLMVAMSAVPAMAQNQPKMEAALRNLQRARSDLSTAATNKGGHRVRAMRLVDQAINETRAGMAYARQHPERRGSGQRYRNEQERRRYEAQRRREQQSRYQEQHRREQQRRYQEQHRRQPHATPTPHGRHTPYPPGSSQGPGH